MNQAQIIKITVQTGGPWLSVMDPSVENEPEAKLLFFI
jgi:hypothetical protein